MNRWTGFAGGIQTFGVCYTLRCSYLCVYEKTLHPTNVSPYTSFPILTSDAVFRGAFTSKNVVKKPVRLSQEKEYPHGE